METRAPNGHPEPGPGAIPALRAVAVALGFAALGIQVLMLRELMMAWRGSEMSFGVVLSIWLALTGAGSLAGGRLAARRRGDPLSPAIPLLGLAVVAPAAILVARVARIGLGLSVGELSSLPPLVLTSLICLAPFTLLAGHLFALNVDALSRHARAAERAIGEVYVLEAVGAAAAGLLLRFAVLPRLGGLQAASIIALPVAGLAVAVALAAARRRAVVAGAAAALLAAVLAAAPGRALDEATMARQWGDLGYVSSLDSIYGRIVATRLGSQRALYASGVLAASVPDRLAAEEPVHLPLLEHPAPTSVLLLGGGLAGSVSEILKHPGIDRVDYVELDPALVAAARAHFGDDALAGLTDPRVRVHYSDARFFVKRAGDRYDVVIVNAPDPTTAQLNRYYTSDFFAEVAGVLAPGGVVGSTISSAENYIPDELADLLASLHRTLAEIFPSVVTIPGDPCHLIAAAAPTRLTRDPAVLAERIAERRIHTAFVRDYYLVDRLRPDRTDQLDAALARGRGFTNLDLRPVCTFQSLRLWNRQFASTPRVFGRLPEVLTLPWAAVVAALLAASLSIRGRGQGRSKRRFARNVVAAVLVVGFTEITLEIAALLAFQSLYGYVYHQLALIVAAFMAGLAVGGWLGTRAADHGAGARAFVTLQLGIALVPPALAGAIVGVSRLAPGGLAAWSGLFPLIVICAAVLAGMQFPIAGRLLHSGAGGAGPAGGRLYGVDLLGSAVGATCSAVFLLPIMGVVGTMAALALLNVGVLASLAWSSRACPGR